MTYFDAGSAPHVMRSLLASGMLVLLGAGLGGCESSSSIFGSFGTSAPTEVAQPAAPVQQPLRKLSMTPVIGAPEAVAKQLSAQLGSAAGQHRFEILADRDAKGEFTLRGYLVAARDKAGTKISYIWDLSDGTGKRVHRITGDEMAAASPNAKDPWAAVTPDIIGAISTKTATALGAWLPSQPVGAAGPAVAAAPGQTPAQSAAGAGAANLEPAVVESRPVNTNTTTAALPARADNAVAAAPTVTGAPGDGNAALAEALQRELSRQGVSLIDKPGSSYRVEGKVVVGSTKEGKQPIQIDWRVKDPQGKSLGTVSQKNEIPPGSLDGEWGKTADAAAAAAAQGIVKLLPQAKSTN